MRAQAARARILLSFAMTVSPAQLINAWEAHVNSLLSFVKTTMNVQRISAQAETVKILPSPVMMETHVPLTRVIRPQDVYSP